jgi:uncharacterized membrane protein
MAQYFRLHGLTGMLLAVVILLSLVVFFGTKAVAVQQAEATNFYKIDKPFEIEKFNKDTRSRHLVDAK